MEQQIFSDLIRHMLIGAPAFIGLSAWLKPPWYGSLAMASVLHAVVRAGYP
jgi:hypothetical protein